MKRLYVTFVLLGLVLFSLAAANSEIVSLELPSQNSGAARDLDPLQLQIESIGAGSLRLSWNAVAGADSYLIFCADQPLAFDSPDWEQLMETSESSHIFEACQSHQFFYVKAIITEAADGFVYVPGGTFTMGDTRGGGYSSALPLHSVTLNSFYISKYHVTQAEYVQYMQPYSSWTSAKGLGDNYPAYYVSWYAVIKYCNLRSMAEGLTPVYTILGSTNPANWGAVPSSWETVWSEVICNWSANGYRLPTEAEWEYAARGATNEPDYLYSGSDDIYAVAWCSYNSGGSTHPVGSKAPNGLGVYDMSGNLSEWCWDWHGAYGSEPETNPTGPPTGGSYRRLRGGSRSNMEHNCRVSYRGGYAPGGSYDYAGFRLCRTDM